MCGIVGRIGSRPATPDDYKKVELARDELHRRGPDAKGLWSAGQVVFGFRRLAIIDLTAEADQPMIREDLGLSLVFNGEIYNYLELRNELEGNGVVFQTRSDTEVILAAYSTWGTDCFSRFNGMFAIALYDLRSQTLTFARDRFGKKPLYYLRTDDGLFFASEVKALRRMVDFDQTIRPESLSAYFAFGYIPQSVGSYPQVRQMEPSTWAQFSTATLEEIERRPYWGPSYQTDVPSRYEMAMEKLESLLVDAVAIRMRSDVPVAAFLSGGIDSTLVVGMANNHNPLPAITIGFEGWKRSEHLLAAQTAAHLGLSHHVELTDKPLISEELILHFDEPYCDWSCFATAKVCELARQTARVLLSGDGGDEGFAGYDAHIRAHRLRMLRALPYPIAQMVGVIGASLPDSSASRLLERIGEPWSVWGVGGHFSVPNLGWWLYLSNDLRRSFTTCIYPKLAHDVLSTIKAKPRSVREGQELTIKLYMTDDVLAKVDRMSMYHSVEVRSPLLDYRVVDFGLNLPPQWKIRGGRGKAILRDLASRYATPEIINAPKRGFGAPIHDWLQNEAVQKRSTEVILSAPGMSSIFNGEKFIQDGGLKKWPVAAFRAYVLGLWLESGRVKVG